MINRAKMPRQLRNKGGIASIAPREKYGLGSKLKKRFRKLIPNELASVAVKAAPIVSVFNPGVGALMRGIGRFDQRGSISDALKQGIGTFAFGAGARALGGASDITGGGLRGGFTSPLSPERTQQFTSLFEAQKVKEADDAKKGLSVVKKAAESTIGKVPILKELPSMVQQQLVVSGLTAGASLLASYFQGEFREQEPGETMEEYLAARKDVVGKQMRAYMDNYFANDPEYMKLDSAGRDAFVARYNVRDGGRIGFQEGGIEERLEQLGSDVTSAEELLQGINQRLKTAESSLGSGGVRLPEISTNEIPFEFDNNRPRPNMLIPQRPSGPGSLQRPAGLGIFASRPIQLPGIRPDFSATIDPNFKPVEELKAVQPGDPGYRAPGPTTLNGVVIDNFNTNNPFPSVEEAFANAQREAQESRRKGFLGQVVLPGEMSFEDFSKNFNRFNNFGQPMQLPLSRGGPNQLQTALGFATGGMPTGIMRTNKVGVKERDYRETGGFVPVGVKEKADDVPAMLSKNEFVFTADAVRGAGNGSIEKGAQKMYDTMKRLEKRVV